MKLHQLASLTLLTLAAPAFAATPASGELSDTSGPQTFTGGPYLVPTPAGITSAARAVGCMIPMSCDEYALTVNIADKFRMDKKNEKEVVQIIMTHSNPTPAGDTADIDLYLVDSAGNDVASSTSPSASEAITVPLKTLKNGAYTVLLITGIPLGSSELVEIRIGRGTKADAEELKELFISPMVAAPDETVAFETRNLNAVGDYTFNFGDNSPEFTSNDGLATHAYTNEGVYTASVTYIAPGKGLASVTQPVVIESVSSAISGVADKSGTNFGGGFGLPMLFSLFGLALLRRKA